MTGSSFQLYTADAIDLMRALPDESVDLIITDVAYESLEKYRAVGTTTRLKQSDASSNEWFPIFRNSRFGEFFQEAFRVLKKDAHLYFYCDPETAFVAKPVGEEAGFKFWKPLVWGKTKQGMAPDADELTVEHQGIGMGYHYRASYEFVLFFEKGKRKLNDLGVRDLLPFPGIRNGYPTEKPTDLNRVFVRQSSESGETVLDPFMGSGSTGVAAVRNGRHFIGGDVKETAVVEARKRLLANAATDGGQAFTVVEGARPPEPEPPKKKTRAKKTAPVPEKSGENGAQRSAESAEIEPAPAPFAHISGYITDETGAEPRDREAEEHAKQLGTKPIPASAGILETLDALGVPHREVPRQMFKVEVSHEPLPPPPAVSAIEMIEAAFAGVEHPKLDGFFPTGPLPGGPTRHLPPPQLTPPPRPESCRHGDLRSACILCRSRR